jgi:hypothetical protein
MEINYAVRGVGHNRRDSNRFNLSLSLRGSPVMGDLISYKTFIARRAKAEVARLEAKDQKEHREKINRLLGYTTDKCDDERE